MLRERFAVYRDRTRRDLTRAFEAEHAPHEIAASFAVGIFVTAMPTGGLGIGLFFLLAYRFSWVNKPAIFASIAVLNPLVKPAVYLVSLQVGALVLDTGSLLPRESTATESAVAFGFQLLVGNLLVAITLSAVAYVTVLHLTRDHRRRVGDDRDSTLSVSSLLDRRR